MAKKVEKDDKKWGNFAEGCLVGTEFVSLNIPKDKTNPTTHVSVILNGSEAILAVGKKIEVPEPIADLWNYSYEKTQEAEESINTDAEIK